ncbi:hypothetical protein FRB95_008627 [Tulasnella sp. JGI-2019a]|nr:hypothetical protein FRB95_008627 [Tulasnella sp. JGI-2019a]
MLPISTDVAAAATLGLISLWLVKRVVDYRRDVSLIGDIPGYRGLGPANSSLYGLMHAKVLQLVEDGYLFSQKHLHYERLGWDVISSVYWFSSKPRFYITDANVIQHIGATRNQFQKPVKFYEVFNLFGRNVITVEGTEWSRHRKVTSRAFSERNIQVVWEHTTRIVNEMFESDWSRQGNVVVLEDVLHSVIQLSMLVIMAAGFGQEDTWIANPTVPKGHSMTFRKALHDAVENIILRVSVPQWVWGSEADRATLAVAGPGGNGWLGKKVQHVAVAYSEVASYMREMLADQLGSGQTQTINGERGNLFHNLVAALEDQNKSGALPMDAVFGNTFMFMMGGFETSAHAISFTLGLLALEQEEQEKLYNHINEVLQDREPTFDDITKLTRVLAVFLETTRLYPPTAETTRIVTEDAAFSVGAALSDADIASGKVDERHKEIMIPKGSEVVIDMSGVHHNPRYWPDPYTFKPDRFLDANWPREAHTSFWLGPRACMGKRFAEVEAMTVITLIVRRYKLTVDTKRFPDIPGETKLERRERVLKVKLPFMITPCGIPLVLTRR